MSNNHVLGRGRLYFDRFTAGTTTGTGEQYIGNTPAFSVTSTTESLDHFSSDSGVREKDLSVTISNNHTLTFSSDNISWENLAIRAGTTPTTRSLSAVTDDGDTLTVLAGRTYQLGRRASRPEGIRGITGVTVRDDTGTKATGTITFAGQPSANDTITINGHVITFKASGATGAEVNLGGTATLTAQALKVYINDHPDECQVVASGAAAAITVTATASGTWGNSIGLVRSGSHPTLSGATLSSGTNGASIPASGNWTADLTNGRLYIEADGQIADGDTIVVTYDVTAQTQTLVSNADDEVEGLLRFIADNPTGRNTNFVAYRVKLRPDGALDLKGDTWQTMTFSGEILRLDDATPHYTMY